MQSDRERLFQISRIIEGVSACLMEFSDSDGPIDMFYAMELIGRLDFAVDSIRLINDAAR